MRIVSYFATNYTYLQYTIVSNFQNELDLMSFSTNSKQSKGCNPDVEVKRFLYGKNINLGKHSNT
jgi:hypothetical protein